MKGHKKADCRSKVKKNFKPRGNEKFEADTANDNGWVNGRRTQGIKSFKCGEIGHKIANCRKEDSNEISGETFVTSSHHTDSWVSDSRARDIRCLIAQYSNHFTNMTNIPLDWTPELTNSFDIVKPALTNYILLLHPRVLPRKFPLVPRVQWIFQTICLSQTIWPIRYLHLLERNWTVFWARIAIWMEEMK